MTNKKGGENGDAVRDDNGRFLPGHGGGPGRPPKDSCLSDLMRAELLKPVTIPKLDKNGKKTGQTRTITKMQLFVESQIELASAGDAAAAKNVWERVEGKVPNPVEVTGEGGGPISVVYDKAFEGV